MTFKEQFHAHIGGLVRLKTDLYWYNTRSRDGIKGRICLLLDAADGHPAPPRAGYVTAAITATGGRAALHDREGDLAHVLLLIDGHAKWIWTSREDVEFVQ
jgi:hypothetical protein